MAGSITTTSGDTVVTGHSVSDNTASESILVILDEPYSSKAGDYSAQILAGGSDSDGLSLADCDTEARVIWLGSGGKLYMLHMNSKTVYAGTVATVSLEGGAVSGNMGAFNQVNFASGEDAVAFMKLASSYDFSNLAAYEDDDHLIAEYVTDFKASLQNSIDAANNVTGAVVNVSLTFEEQDVKYTVSNKYSIRNVLR